MLRVLRCLVAVLVLYAGWHTILQPHVNTVMAGQESRRPSPPATALMHHGSRSVVRAGAGPLRAPTDVGRSEVVVIQASGATSATIQSAVDAFRRELGANNGVGGTFESGRREVNWDGIPANFLDPFPGDFFLTRSARGIQFSSPGTRLKVSGDPGTSSFEFADVTAVIPQNGQPWGPIEFGTFSPHRMFAPIDSTVTEVRFKVPSTNMAATVSAFGAVFADVDQAYVTKMTFFGVNDAVLYEYEVPPAGVQSEGLTFVGVRFPNGERVKRVVIRAGSHPVNTPFMDPPPDGVGIDDVIYSEPVAMVHLYLPLTVK